MRRRELLGGLAGILASGIAPAGFSSAVAGGILMPIRQIIMPPSVPWSPDTVLNGSPLFMTSGDNLQIDHKGIKYNFVSNGTLSLHCAQHVTDAILLGWLVAKR